MVFTILLIFSRNLAKLCLNMKSSFTALGLLLLCLPIFSFAQTLRNFGISSSGEFSANFFYSADQLPLYQIQYSNDLRHWFPLGKTLEPLTDNLFDFRDNLDSSQRFYRIIQFDRVSVPLLIILMDFQDTAFPADLVNVENTPEESWSELMFGEQQGQGNHYWTAATYGRFIMMPANETFAVHNNGVIHVRLGYNAPNDGNRYIVENQPWLMDSIAQAGAFIDFATYDANSDSKIGNRELSILFVLNLPFSSILGAGAQANITFNHAVNGVTVEKIARVISNYSSIGVNLHELGHHFFELEHGADPTGSTLMGTGAYNEDPVITKFTSTFDHWGTRPSHLSAESKERAGIVEPELIDGSLRGIPLFSASSPFYNVVKMTTVDGHLLIENRTKEGYDLSMPFAEGDVGGLFASKVVVFRRLFPNNPDNLGFELKDYYRYKNYHDEFKIGGLRIYNISEPGTKMTFDVEKLDINALIEDYRFVYWVNDPDRIGYRLWNIAPGDSPSIVFLQNCTRAKPPNDFFISSSVESCKIITS